MTPTHIKNEVIHRLYSAEDVPANVLAALDIDAGASPADTSERPQPLAGWSKAPIESEPTYGFIPFELAVSVMGEATTLDCRANFAVTLHHEMYDKTGEPIRIICSLTMHYDVLDWQDPDHCNPETGEPRRLKCQPGGRPTCFRSSLTPSSAISTT